MSISEIQFVKIDAASSGSFGSDVGAHSVLLLWQFAYTTSGATISTSSPTFDSVSGAGPVKAMEAQSPGGDAVYGVLWVLPPPSGGWPSSAGPLATTVTNGNVDDNVAMFIAEFAVTGNSLIVDTGASPNPATGAEASGDLASGSTGDITTAPELILGMGVGFGFDLSEVGAPWTELRSGSDLCVCGYQVAASSGGSYSYDPAGSNAGWVAGAVALKSAGGGTPHTATAALTVTPTFSAMRTRGKYRTGALTVTPSFSAVRQRGKYRTGSLTVPPSFSAARTRGKYRTAVLTVGPSFSAARLHGHGRTASLIVTPTFSAARTAARVRTASLHVIPQFRALWSGGAAPKVQTGSWWGLHSVFEESRQEFEAEWSRPPVACPVCGEPLVNAPSTASGSGVELYCRYSGDHDYRYPRDWHPPTRPGY